MFRLGRWFLVSAALVLPAAALVSGPYTTDSNTIHLFHLDEAAGASTTANTGSVGRTAYACDGSPIATTPTAVTTILGSAGFSGFGNAADFAGNTDYFIGYDAAGTIGFRADVNGTSLSSDAVALSSLGINGSNPFTLEAMVKPSGITGFREIISTDSSAVTRGFQFRIIAGGTTGQQLEFNLIGVSGTQKFADIPNAGTHAFTTGTWFHVALAYDGSNVRFYWTKVDATVTQANLVSTQALTFTGGGTITGPLILGNENRGTAGEGINGALDEVRISKVARTASQFIFASDDSDADGLPDTWEILQFGNLGQTASGDPDGDGFTNVQEFAAGTDPNNAALTPNDTDGDGLPDAWELTNFVSITAQDGNGDPDGDFASNALEYAASSNPTNAASWPETDGDGMNDGWEIFYFGNLSHDGTADGDHDGSTDKQEHDANSNPLNPLWSAIQATLAHRWSFNGNLADSSGGMTASIVDPDTNAAAGGTATLTSSDVLLGGGARATSAYIQLGSGGLLAGHKTPVTIELWATQVAVQNWARIFDFGSGSTEYLFMSWTRGTVLTQDRVEWTDSAAIGSNDKAAPYVLGTPYHIVITLEPRAGASGTTRVTWYAAPATSASLGLAKGSFDTSNTLLNLNDSIDYLGRSQYTADNTANARYDEFRIWDGVLSSAERETYQVAGADALSNEDRDEDGVPDAWEMKYFLNLDQTATGDFDGDAYSNAAEYALHSDPSKAASTPLDTDADGLLDNWEINYFGNISASPTADPDGDGENNLTEQTNGSAPNNRASNSTDTDDDGLPDAWELSYFGDLSTNGGSDPDGDDFGNLQEYQSGTNPAVVSSRPSGTAVKLVPLDDGNSSTSDYGYGGSSAINSVAFVRSSVKTVGNQQFITWYGRHQYDAAAAYNNTIWIGRRTLGSSQWEIFRHPSYTANAITDGHDVICYGIDGEGYMHLSWGMHGDAFHYSKSTTPVTGTGTIALGPDTTMTGRENAVTYPQFMTLPSGDLLYLFREGASGTGDTYLNRYSTTTHAWDNVHRSGSTQLPFIKGTGWSPDYNAYVNMPQLGKGIHGNEITLTWCWRYSSGTSDTGSGAVGYQTNSNFYFARSLDAGVTWQRYDGTPYALPISSLAESGVAATRAEKIVDIPENSSLINQASMCLDGAGNAAIASWWAPKTPSGDYSRQYMLVFRDSNNTWQTRTVSNRSIDPAGSRYLEASVRNMGRPIVVNDDSDRLIVAYRDNADTNGITIVHSLPRADDPDRLVWIQFELTTDNLGNYEPIIDNELWDRDRQLHFLYQAAEGQGYVSPANTATRFSVLEWDAATYYHHSPQPTVAFNSDKTQITLTCPSQPSWGYRLWSSTNLIDWTSVETQAGTGGPLSFTQTTSPDRYTKRFWRIQYKEGGFP